MSGRGKIARRGVLGLGVGALLAPLLPAPRATAQEAAARLAGIGREIPVRPDFRPGSLHLMRDAGLAIVIVAPGVGRGVDLAVGEAAAAYPADSFLHLGSGSGDALALADLRGPVDLTIAAADGPAAFGVAPDVLAALDAALAPGAPVVLY